MLGRNLHVCWDAFACFLFLQALLNKSYATDDVCNYEWKSVHAIKNQTISVRFNFKEPLYTNQSLGWIKPASNLNKKSLDSIQCSNDKNSTSRYKLTKTSNQTEYQVIIDCADEVDSGTHYITVYEGENILCTALMLQLTIVSEGPKCTTIFLKERQTLQMTCELFQGNDGGLVQFLAGDRLLYEHCTGNFTGNVLCKTIAINVSVVAPVSTTSIMPSTRDTNSTILTVQDNVSSSDFNVSEEMSSTDPNEEGGLTNLVIYIGVLSAIALLCSFATCIAICFKTCYKHISVRHQYRVQHSHAINMSASRSYVLHAESMDTMTLSSQGAATGGDPEQGGIVENGHQLERKDVLKHVASEHGAIDNKGHPLDRRDILKPEGMMSCPEKHDSPPDLPLRSCMDRHKIGNDHHTEEPTGRPFDMDHMDKGLDNTGTQASRCTDVVADDDSALESTYCSVADVNGTPTNDNTVNKLTDAKPLVQSVLSSNPHKTWHGEPTSDAIASLSWRPKVKRDHSSMTDAIEQIHDLETLYAKPDKNLRTKETFGNSNQSPTLPSALTNGLSGQATVISLDNAYADLRNLEESLCPNIPVLESG